MDLIHYIMIIILKENYINETCLQLKHYYQQNPVSPNQFNKTVLAKWLHWFQPSLSLCSSCKQNENVKETELGSVQLRFWLVA